MILSAVYMLWMFQRVNYGPVTNQKNRGLRDLSVREWFVIAPVCAAAIFMGVLPGVFLKPMGPAVERTLETVVGLHRPLNAAAPAAPAATPRIAWTTGERAPDWQAPAPAATTSSQTSAR